MSDLYLMNHTKKVVYVDINPIQTTLFIYFYAYLRSSPFVAMTF